MNYLILALSVVIGTLRNIFTNRFTSKNPMNKAQINLFNALLFLTGTVVFLLFGNFTVSAYTAKMSVIFAVITLLSQIFFMKALEYGSMSFTTLFTSCAMIIPAIFGIIFYNEQFRPMQGIGLLLILASIAAISFEKGSKEINKKWIFCVFFSFLTSGIVGILQKIHQNSPYREEQGGFLLIAFIIMTAASVIMFISEKMKTKKPLTFGQSKADVIITAVLSGLMLSLLHKINLYLSGALAGIVFFPIHNGGVIVFSAISSFLIFHEKLSKPKLFGILIGLLSIVFLSI